MLFHRNHPLISQDSVERLIIIANYPHFVITEKDNVSRLSTFF